MVSGRVNLKDKTGPSSRTVFCLAAQSLGLNSDIKVSGRISQIIVIVLNLKCTGSGRISQIRFTSVTVEGRPYSRTGRNNISQRSESDLDHHHDDLPERNYTSTSPSRFSGDPKSTPDLSRGYAKP
ncbi:hypothetical protein F2Q69_00027961 [Brassica cretica]|uniref:Uncharacterized protein n=1 Tax=Brassica cretica TaxID=69181 RepID=A0A8S9RYY0_BRACR|nr:hypothetical protein F2Q69_00027961 [Brassica cretica]